MRTPPARIRTPCRLMLHVKHAVPSLAQHMNGQFTRTNPSLCKHMMTRHHQMLALSHIIGRRCYINLKHMMTRQIQLAR